LSTTETALTAHLVMPVPSEKPDFLAEIVGGLRHEFQIGHSTIQVDAAGAGEDCALCSERPSASATRAGGGTRR
jgi:cobalt-zinc-cadmium efflux system protein